MRMIISGIFCPISAFFAYISATGKHPSLVFAVFYGAWALVFGAVFLRGGKPLVGMDTKKPLGQVTWHGWKGNKNRGNKR